MSMRIRWMMVMAVMGLAATSGRAWGEDKVGPNGEKLVLLDIQLPKPMFQGTPKNIPASATMEKYDERPRAAFYAPEGVTNLAAKKTATSSDSSPIIGELTMLTDGDKDGADGSYVELAPDKQWVQIDLGAKADIYALVVWHYHGEARVYHDIVVQIADNPEFTQGVKTIFNNDFDNSAGLGAGKNLEYVEDFRGKLIPATDAQGRPTQGRYVRLYSNGNTSNDMNHYVEVEVWGKPAN